jgi:hypothetical protein
MMYVRSFTNIPHLILYQCQYVILNPMVYLVYWPRDKILSTEHVHVYCEKHGGGEKNFKSSYIYFTIKIYLFHVKKITNMAKYSNDLKKYCKSL